MKNIGFGRSKIPLWFSSKFVKPIFGELELPRSRAKTLNGGTSTAAAAQRPHHRRGSRYRRYISCSFRRQQPQPQQQQPPALA